MPLDDYNSLLARCTATAREYEILKNGLITPYGDGEKPTPVVLVLCTEADAKALLKLARKIHRDAAGRMRQYPAAD